MERGGSKTRGLVPMRLAIILTLSRTSSSIFSVVSFLWEVLDPGDPLEVRILCPQGRTMLKGRCQNHGISHGHGVTIRLRSPNCGGTSRTYGSVPGGSQAKHLAQPCPAIALNLLKGDGGCLSLQPSSPPASP